MNYKKFAALSVFLIIFFTMIRVGAEGTETNKRNSLSKTNGFPNKTQLNINNISTWFINNGGSDLSPLGNSGFVFPKGSNKTAVYESGFVWGATVNGELRVGGSTYNHGLQGGAIIDGVPEDPKAAHVRIYRVRSDWKDGSLLAEMNDGEGAETAIRAQYEKDWNEWPASFGAPYEDIDDDGNYDPSVDVPGFPGANQTIWFVSNDYGEQVAEGLYGSPAMGIEMQATFWGYALGGTFGNVIFRKYKIINKSTNVFDSMYVSMWSDPDLGDAGDDFSGCDVDLSLMYTYNGAANDATYGANPPAVGFDFFQGPIVPGEVTDTAIFNNKKRAGYKNLPMSAHYFFINRDNVYTDPPLNDYNGTIQFHNLFRGRITTTGEPFIDPNTGLETKFTLSGDPVTGTGWIDGQIHAPGDRRQGMVAGPFTMAVGDTQEIVIAELVAGGTPGVSYLDAISQLKVADGIAQAVYDDFFQLPPPPAIPKVSATALDQEIILNWGWDLKRVAATESNNVAGIAGHGTFKYQGYNIYQLPSKSATKKEAVRIATLDLIDGIKVILDEKIDPASGVTLQLPAQYGNDNGINRTIQITKDYVKNEPLYNGTKYYFAVTAYSYNPDPLSVPNNLENPLAIVEVIPESGVPGMVLPEETYSSGLEVTHSKGLANAKVTVKVVDPAALTGDDYEIFFNQQHYYMDVDGKWKKTNYADSVGRALAKVGDVSPSTVTGISSTSPTPGTRDLKFTVNVISPDFNFADGVKLVFPAGIKINSANGDGIASLIDDATNAVIFGKEVKDSTDLTGEGVFGDKGVLITVNVNTPVLPLSVNYTVYDDGWATLYCKDTANAANCTAWGITDAVVKNAEGVCVITEEAFAFHTESHWNVKNITKDAIILEDQLVVKNTNTFTGANEGPTAAPVVDGLQIDIEDGGYAAPVGILSYFKNGIGPYPFANGKYTIDLSDYGMHGWAATGRAIDAFGNGTNDVDILQQDYELRYTGEYEEIAAGADSVMKIKEGTGSMATLYGARGYDLKDHPLNPNPGSSDPFLIRIPFEIWNVDANQQVNLLVYDRKGDATKRPFYSFNPFDRMYCYINNTPYAADVVNSGDKTNADTDNLTWNVIFWKNDLKKGDVVNINYANPLQLGKDVFTFTAPKITTDPTKAKDDVKNINVFPNPYYGTHNNEVNKYQRFVTFNHLPKKATIRVFNLAGQLIKTVEKDDATQFARWDLANENGLPAASGMYVVYIDMPDLGETKILKVAIIQETQILDRF